MNSATLRESESFWKRLCFDAGFKAKGRYAVYREMVADRMIETLKSVAPVARSFLSEAEWKKLLAAFFKGAAPVTEVIRDLAGEVAAFLKKNRHPLAKKYPFLGELIEYEYLEVKVRYFPESKVETPRGKISVNPAHILAEYRWPVHFISEQLHDAKKLPQGEYHLLLWRHPESLEVKFMEVNALTADLLRHLERGPAAS
ncbi:MAG TPA: hypothetical protein DF383_09085, partial [Deltaproteobacteria bacterium]|nr:hypothetical protein [Deltaproteobacteria bacterium]